MKDLARSSRGSFYDGLGRFSYSYWYEDLVKVLVKSF